MWLALLPVSSALGDATAGAAVYARRCSQCHGDEGLADGPAAGFVLPRPRVLADNFSYKIRSTPSGELPTDEDLYRVISEGLPGTSMPPFDEALSEAERWDVVAYVKALSPDFSDPVYVEAIVPMTELAAPTPPSTPQAVSRGEELYVENECFKCHGRRGRGDGPSWPDLDDDWGDPILPANLANPEHFRGGSGADDVFRAISTGLNGTPMPSYAASLTPEQRWDLAHYVVSLAPSAELDDETVRGLAVDRVPEDWAGVPVTRVPLVPNVIEAPRLYFQAVGFVMVQAVYTDEELTLRLEWDDRTASTGTDDVGDYADRDGAIYRGTAHPDQLAIQLPAKPDDRARPYLLFGDARRPVRLWWWTSSEGVSARTGRGFENISRLDPAPAADVSWSEGRYTMLLTHPLDPELGLEPGAFVPLALSAWDGELGEVGTRRGLSSWRWLFLEPEVPKRAYVAPPLGFLLAFGALGVLVRATRRRAARSEG